VKQVKIPVKIQPSTLRKPFVCRGFSWRRGSESARNGSISGGE
jgi:hypothetical protein